MGRSQGAPRRASLATLRWLAAAAIALAASDRCVAQEKAASGAATPAFEVRFGADETSMEVSGRSGTQRYRLDEHGRAARIDDTVSGLALELQYDLWGRVAAATVRGTASAYRVEIVQDGFGRLIGLADDAGSARVSYAKDAATCTLSSGVQTTYSIDRTNIAWDVKRVCDGHTEASRLRIDLDRAGQASPRNVAKAPEVPFRGAIVVPLANDTLLMAVPDAIGHPIVSVWSRWVQTYRDEAHGTLCFDEVKDTRKDPVSTLKTWKSMTPDTADLLQAVVVPAAKLALAPGQLAALQAVRRGEMGAPFQRLRNSRAAARFVGHAELVASLVDGVLEDWTDYHAQPPEQRQFWRTLLAGHTGERVAGELESTLADTLGDQIKGRLAGVAKSNPRVAAVLGYGRLFVDPAVQFAHELAVDRLRGNRSVVDFSEHATDFAVREMATLIVAVGMSRFEKGLRMGSAGPMATRAVAPAVADLAVGIESACRSALAESSEETGRALATHGARSAGEHLYQSAVAMAYGMDPTRFQSLMGGLGDRTWKDNAAFDAFSTAVGQRDYARAADLLDERRIREALHASGAPDSAVDAVQASLRARVASGVSPRADFDDAERRLGGVSLGAVPAFGVPLGHVVGVTFDAETGRIVVVGDGDRSVVGLRADDLAAAFAAVFGQVGEKYYYEPSFSLDPAEPTNPDGDWYRAVYYPGYLGGTSMGQAMYEADWLMKQYSFGLRVDPVWRGHLADGDRCVGQAGENWSTGTYVGLSVRPRVSEVPGLLAIPQIRKEMADAGRDRMESSVRNRLWLVVEDPIDVGTSKGACTVGPARIGVRARRMQVGKDGTLKDVEDASAQDPLAGRFARDMTSHYRELAAEEPAFARLQVLAQAVAVAKWVQSSLAPGSRPDLRWIMPFVNRSRVVAATRLQAVQVETKRTQLVETTSTYTISGGADLTVQIAAAPAPKAAELEAGVRAALAKGGDAMMIDVACSGVVCRGAVLPTGADAQRNWTRCTDSSDGAVYQLGDAGRAVASLAPDGAERRFERGADGTLSAISSTTPAGVRSVWHRPDESGTTRFELETATGEAFSFRWSADLATGSATREGARWLEFSDFAAPGAAGVRSSVVRHVSSGSSEQVDRDADGRVLRTTRRRNWAGGSEIEDRVDLAHDAAGRLTSILRADGLAWAYAYDEHGRLASVRSPTFECLVSYANNGPRAKFPSRIDVTAPFRLTVRLESGVLGGIEGRDGPSPWTAEFEGGCLIRTTDGTAVTQLSYYENGTVRSLAEVGTPKAEPQSRFEWAPDGSLLHARVRDGTEAVLTYAPDAAAGRTLAKLRVEATIR